MIIRAELKCKQTGCEADPCQARGSSSSAAHC